MTVERKAYVLEGRNKRSVGRWVEQQSDCGYGARRRIYSKFRDYRKQNPHHVFRVVVYKPTESTR